MRIALSSADGQRLCGHAGKSRHWTVREADGRLTHLSLEAAQLFHNWKGKPGEHPLEQVDVLVTGSAGAGFVRRLEKAGVRVVVTGEKSLPRIIERLLRGETLPAPGFNPLLLVCKLRDWIGGH